MKQYRVVDCHAPAGMPNEQSFTAASPEAAAQLALGVKLVRGGIPSDLRAKVYYAGFNGDTSMVRLYTKAKIRP